MMVLTKRVCLPTLAAPIKRTISLLLESQDFSPSNHNKLRYSDFSTVTMMGFLELQICSMKKTTFSYLTRKWNSVREKTSTSMRTSLLRTMSRSPRSIGWHSESSFKCSTRMRHSKVCSRMDLLMLKVQWVVPPQCIKMAVWDTSLQCQALVQKCVTKVSATWCPLPTASRINVLSYPPIPELPICHLRSFLSRSDSHSLMKR